MTTFSILQLMWIHRKTIFVGCLGSLGLVLSLMFLNHTHQNFEDAEEQNRHLKMMLFNEKESEKRRTLFKQSQTKDASFKLFKAHKADQFFQNKHATKFLKQSKKTLKIEKMQISMSPDIVEKILDISFLKTKIQLDIKSFSDKKNFQMVDMIYKKFPGIVEFQEISIKKNDVNLANKRLKGVYLFHGKIVFHWSRQKNES